MAGRAYRLAEVPWHDGGQKIGAGVHIRFDRPETVETDWPGGWPFGGRYRMLHVTELIAMVDLRRGELVHLTCGPGCEREPDVVTWSARLFGPVLELLFGGRH